MVIDYHLSLGCRPLVSNYCKSAKNWLWSIIDQLAATGYRSWNCNRFPTLRSRRYSLCDLHAGKSYILLTISTSSLFRTNQLSFICQDPDSRISLKLGGHCLPLNVVLAKSAPTIHLNYPLVMLRVNPLMLNSYSWNCRLDLWKFW